MRRRNRIVSENLLNSSEIFFCRELRTIQELTRKYHGAPNKASEAETEESSLGTLLNPSKTIGRLAYQSAK